MISRRSLVYEAAQEAADARDAGGFDPDSPISPFDLAASLNINVQFVPVSMEGFYRKEPSPLILLSPYRPIGRRAYNCAHELGHHRFGHGSTIHELNETTAGMKPSEIPEEILADSFAGFALMPAIGIRRAFALRGCAASNASPLQVFAVSSDFGVGYTSLITHLTFSLQEIDNSRRKYLESFGLPDFRRMVLGRAEPKAMALIDEHSEVRCVEMDVDAVLHAPPGATSTSRHLVYERTTSTGEMFRAKHQGIGSLLLKDRIVEVRIAREDYVGFTRYRFLEDPDD